MEKFCIAPLQLPFPVVHATASQFTGTSCLPIHSIRKFKKNLCDRGRASEEGSEQRRQIRRYMSIY